jgi:6-phosphofructokinase 1
VGIPKTIDNDLSATDYTFGFHTALDIATDALDRLHTTAESHHRAMILEVMGRDAGWIALHSGLAGGAHIILIPEIPFDLDVVTEQVRHRNEQLGAKFSVIVVAEGCQAPGYGQILVPGTVEGAVARLTGIGNWLCAELATRSSVETRATVLGHIQRGGSPNVVDRILATRFGCEAVSLVAKGRFGEMVALRGNTIKSVSLAEAVDRIKLVPPDSQLVQNARQLGICLGDTMAPDATRSQ